MIGGGGHAKVVVDGLRLGGREILGFVDPRQPEQAAPGLPSWLGDDDAVLRHGVDTVELANGVGSTASTVVRRNVFQRFQALGYRFPAIVHPSAILARDAMVSEGAQIMAGVVVQSGARIGVNAILNTRCAVDHDCDIGAHAHLAPGSVLSGSVTIGEGAHIGTGAAIIQGKSIGPYSVVGAGAVIVTDIPPNVLALGVPARIIRQLQPD